MRKLFLLPAILFSTVIVLQSCSKDAPDNMVAAQPENVISAAISVNQPYQLSVSDLGDVSISKQASHFQVSKTELDTKDGVLVYKYLPEAGYTGTDEVVLSTRRAVTTYNTGCGISHSNAETVTYSTSHIIVKINITK